MWNSSLNKEQTNLSKLNLAHPTVKIPASARKCTQSDFRECQDNWGCCSATAVPPVSGRRGAQCCRSTRQPHCSPCALAPSSSQALLILHQGPAPIHHPTSGLNILAVINRFEESLSLLTTCFTLDSRHESKQNRSTPA